MTRLHEAIADVASEGLTELSDDGAMPAGHNGPYHDPETPARNTSHWTILYLDAYRTTGEERFREAAEATTSYLLSTAARPHGKTFYHRDIEGKDACNGLIGQAWTIEALSTMATELGHEEAQRVAEEVFLLHPFDAETSLWKRVEVDGERLSYDRTFNHQLWFAACGALVPDAPAVRSQVERFLDALPTLLDVESDGLISHLLRPSWSGPQHIQYLVQPSRVQLVRNRVLHRLRPPSHRSKLEEKAIGYHSFNLYAFGLLKRAFPHHSVWDEPSIARTIEYSLSDHYLAALELNPFAFPYNPPGFELPFVWEEFQVGTEKQRAEWVRRQFERCYDESTSRMAKDTEDPATHTARLYEATRLSEYEL